MNLGEFENTTVATKSIRQIMEERRRGAVVIEAGDDAPHSRAKWVEATRQMLGNDQNGKPHTFGRINGLTAKWEVEAIRDRFYLCKKMTSPAKYWWWLRKQDAVKN